MISHPRSVEEPPRYLSNVETAELVDEQLAFESAREAFAATASSSPVGDSPTRSFSSTVPGSVCRTGISDWL
jgi:hypothetical protein